MAGVFWLRGLPPRAPLLRYLIWALLVSAFITVSAALVTSSSWAAYLAFTAAILAAIAAFLTTYILDSCVILGGASAVGTGIVLIVDGFTILPLIQMPRFLALLAAGIATIGAGIALIAVRGAARVDPFVRVSILIVMAGLVTTIVGRSSSFADMTLISAGLAVGGFGIVVLGIADGWSWKPRNSLRELRHCVVSLFSCSRSVFTVIGSFHFGIYPLRPGR